MSKYFTQTAIGSKVRIAESGDSLIFTIAFFLANLRASIFIFLYPDPSHLLSPAWIEIGLWLLVVFALSYKLVRNNRISDYWFALRRNWIVVVFVLLALLSVFWSIDRIVTLFRALELLLATLLAVYLGMYFSPRQLMEFLFWFGAVLLILSITLVFAAPRTGTMYWMPFDGAWRGIFWHRNHFSSVTALLSAVFLFRAIDSFKTKDAKIVLDGMFYILSVFVLIRTQSVTGYLLFIFLNLLAICIWLWLKLQKRLRTWHYYLLLFGSVAGLFMVFFNLNAIFGLFNRSSSMTGRVPLWISLLSGNVSERLWWGHGFGAFWTQDSFREDARLLAGWTSQPLIADNGFLDVLLHLGIVGLLLLLSILVIAIVRSTQYALSHKTLTDFFPFLLILYTLVANIPFSLFAETEVFIWMLIVAVIVMTMPSRNPASERLQQKQITSEI